MTEKEFASFWVEKIKGELKIFPDDFLNNWKTEEVILPPKTLFLPSPLFNSYQIIDDAGETFYSTDEHFKAKFIMYVNRYKPSLVKIPVEDLHIYEAVRDYEKHLDSFLKKMEADFKQNFQNPKGFKRISIQIFNTLNLIRY
jgi:hypothetical protein